MIQRIKSLIFRPSGNRRVRSARTSTPASARLEALRRWIVWLIALAIVFAAVLAFASFSTTDPAWSTTGSAVRVKNWLGSTGAWLSDIGYFVLGATVWWLLAFAAAGYAAVRLAEAYGLWFDRNWASWLGALSGGIYVPIEVYELVEKPSLLRLGLLSANTAIVVYLGYRLWRRRTA